MMPGRRWSDGLHQAVEAKEGVSVAGENQTLATVTFQDDTLAVGVGHEGNGLRLWLS